jgi:hypothetical protein
MALLMMLRRMGRSDVTVNGSAARSAIGLPSAPVSRSLTDGTYSLDQLNQLLLLIARHDGRRAVLLEHSVKPCGSRPRTFPV